MLGPGTSAGNVYQYADLKQAAKTFLSVSWATIHAKIAETNNEIIAELDENGMTDLLRAWKEEVKTIDSTLKDRYDEVINHIKFAMEK